MPMIVEAVIATKGDAWNESTRITARTDAERILEALVAEYGVEAAYRALENQGFEAKSCGYVLKPLFEEALARRRHVRAPTKAPTGRSKS